MSDTVISVEGLSKRYALGAAEKASSFREAVSGVITAPFRRLRNLGSGGGTEEFWALKDVSFEVKRGEVVGVIGRNGAGKSTLLKVLSRITPPTSGRIRLKGRVASLLEVGTGFHPELTGRENIFLNGAILGMSSGEIRRKFDEIVAFSEVEKFLDTPVKRYSSGMYVRLAFAVAAHLEPEILIVDEVLAVGDAAFQKKCLGKMKEVSAGGGRTVLFVSHNMAAVQSLCNAGIVLAHGHIKHIGEVQESIRQYNYVPEQSTCEIRSYSGGPFSRIQITVGGDDSPTVRSLDVLRVRVLLVAGERIGRLGAHIVFETDSGSSVGSIDTYPHLAIGSVEQGSSVSACFTIPDLPLRPGRYRLRLMLRDDASFKGFEVPDPHFFEVEDSSVITDNSRYGNRFGPTAFRVNVALE